MSYKTLHILYTNICFIILLLGCVFKGMGQKYMHEFSTPQTNYDKKEIDKLNSKSKKNKPPDIGCKRNASASFDKVDSGSLASSIKDMKIQKQIQCFDPKALNFRTKYQIDKTKYYVKDYVKGNQYLNSGPVSMAIYSTIGTNFSKGVFADVGFLSRFYRKWNLMYNVEVNYSYTSISPIPRSNINFSRIGADFGIGYAADFIERKSIWGLGAIVGGGLNGEFFNNASANTLLLIDPKKPLNQLKYNIFISGFTYLYISNRWGLFFKTTVHILPNSAFQIAETNMTLGVLLRVVSWRNYWKKY